jgi:hypothetical protein
MSDSKAPLDEQGYPHGRGYGHDYMRGGEVLGGYGYAERDEYERPLGELRGTVGRQAETDEQRES